MSAEGPTITLPAGRRLGYLVVGERRAIFHFHDTPSSRFEVLPLKEYALAKGLKVIGVDHSGLSSSTFFPHMSITNVVNDITYLTEHLAHRRVQPLRVRNGRAVRGHLHDYAPGSRSRRQA